MDILFTQIWNDPGLNFEQEEGAQCLANLSLSYRMVDSIWIPNVCLVSLIRLNFNLINLRLIPKLLLFIPRQLQISSLLLCQMGLYV